MSGTKFRLPCLPNEQAINVVYLWSVGQWVDKLCCPKASNNNDAPNDPYVLTGWGRMVISLVRVLGSKFSRRPVYYAEYLRVWVAQQTSRYLTCAFIGSAVYIMEFCNWGAECRLFNLSWPGRHCIRPTSKAAQSQTRFHLSRGRIGGRTKVHVHSSIVGCFLLNCGVLSNRNIEVIHSLNRFSLYRHADKEKHWNFFGM